MNDEQIYQAEWCLADGREELRKLRAALEKTTSDCWCLRWGRSNLCWKSGRGALATATTSLFCRVGTEVEMKRLSTGLVNLYNEAPKLILHSQAIELDIAESESVNARIVSTLARKDESRDDWIIRVRACITKKFPEITVAQVLAIFDWQSPQMDIIVECYRAGKTPKQSYLVLRKRLGTGLGVQLK